MRIFMCIVFGLLYPVGVFSQEFNLGLPFVQSFPRDGYQAAAQNWDILQDERGVMYFANADGLLSYDATAWKVYPLPNKSIVRSIGLSSSGLIFAGGQNEFGVFKPDEIGDWHFQSLTNMLPEQHRNFDDVWDLICTEKGVFFRASGKLFLYREDTFWVFESEPLSFLGEIEERIFVQSNKGTVFELIGEEMLELKGQRVPEGDYLTGICSFGGKVILSSLKHGFFEVKDQVLAKWETDFDAELKEQEIRTITNIGPSQMAIGTSFGGLIIVEANQEIGTQIRKEDGLLRNRILSLFKDKNENLWLGLDNGINHVQTNSPFSRIYPDGAFHGTGYDVEILGNKAYFGTSNGLYKTQWKDFFQTREKSMSLVPGSKGQVWGLDVSNGQLFMSHNKGGFSIQAEGDEGIAENFFKESGVWTFDRLKNRPEIMYAGTYAGLSFFEQKGGSFHFLFTLEGFDESSRFVEQDTQGNLWVAQPYIGIYRIELKDDLTKSIVHAYGEKNGLPSDLQNHLFKIRDTVVFCGEKGIYLFDSANDRFTPYTAFDQALGADIKIRRLAEVPNGDIWFITQEEVGFLRQEDRGMDTIWRKFVYPEIETQLNKGFEQIYGAGENHVFITTEEGFVHYNSAADVVPDTFFKALIREVYVSGTTDSLAFSGIFHNEVEILPNQDLQKIPSFSYDENAFRFGFSATAFTHTQYVSYRYRLLGFNKTWSTWSKQKTKEYTNLSAGEYQFQLQARNHSGLISRTEVFAFTLLAPWYANSLAYTVYLLAFLGILLAIYGSQRKKLVNLQEDHQKVIVASEKEIDKLKEEKTQADLAYKQRELVTTTMHLVQKKEMLEAVKDGLKEIRKSSQDEGVNKQVQKLLLMLHQDAVFDDGWKQFMAHFTELNEDLFKQLKSSYPELTPKDLKLCAYLRMNLSTKEMAALQNVTVRGIEASRYRLRKKFNLKPEINLTEFLMSYKG